MIFVSASLGLLAGTVLLAKVRKIKVEDQDYETELPFDIWGAMDIIHIANAV